jgi:hypothetical protein
MVQRLSARLREFSGHLTDKLVVESFSFYGDARLRSGRVSKRHEHPIRIGGSWRLVHHAGPWPLYWKRVRNAPALGPRARK